MLRTSSSTAATSLRTPGTTRTARSSRRRSTTTSEAQPSCTAPRSTASARRTSARSSTPTESRPPGPSRYEEMEPFYTRAEQLYEVRGARGEDPTEPPASAPYPHPAVSHEPRIQQLSDDLAAAGYQPFHAPCGVLLNEDDMPYSRCVRCQDCDGFPCLVHAKSDAEVMAVRPALEHANVTLLTNATAQSPRDDPDGTAVTGVVVERDGEPRDLPAPTSSSSRAARPTRPGCCSPSASDKHPNGLANGSDQVGRNYMFHNSQAVLAALEGAQPDRLPEDARAQRLLLRRARSSIIRSATSRWSASPRRRCTAGRSGRCEARPGLVARRHRRPRASTSGSRPRTCRSRRTASRSPTTGGSGCATATRMRSRRRSCTRSSSRFWATSACTPTTCSRTTPT